MQQERDKRPVENATFYYYVLSIVRMLHFGSLESVPDEWLTYIALSRICMYILLTSTNFCAIRIKTLSSFYIITKISQLHNNCR